MARWLVEKRRTSKRCPPGVARTGPRLVPPSRYRHRSGTPRKLRLTDTDELPAAIRPRRRAPRHRRRARASICLRVGHHASACGVVCRLAGCGRWRALDRPPGLPTGPSRPGPTRSDREAAPILSIEPVWRSAAAAPRCTRFWIAVFRREHTGLALRRAAEAEIAGQQLVFDDEAANLLESRSFLRASRAFRLLVQALKFLLEFSVGRHGRKKCDFTKPFVLRSAIVLSSGRRLLEKGGRLAVTPTGRLIDGQTVLERDRFLVAHDMHAALVDASIDREADASICASPVQGTVAGWAGRIASRPEDDGAEPTVPPSSHDTAWPLGGGGPRFEQVNDCRRVGSKRTDLSAMKLISSCRRRVFC